VKRLRELGAKVLIVASYPELETPAPTRLAFAAQNGQPTPHGPSRKSYLARQEHVLTILTQLDRLDGVTVIYPHELLCSADFCDMARNGRRLYFDDNHIDIAANRLLEPIFEENLKNIK
jgi:hypothetical protein